MYSNSKSYDWSKNAIQIVLQIFHWQSVVFFVDRSSCHVTEMSHIHVYTPKLERERENTDTRLQYFLIFFLMISLILCITMQMITPLLMLDIILNQRLPGACNRSPGSKLLSITTQLHCGCYLGGRARLPDTILEEDHPKIFMWISHRFLC